MPGGRPIEAIGMMAAEYGVKVRVIRHIGVGRFRSMSHDARMVCLNEHRRRTGEELPSTVDYHRLRASDIAAVLKRVTGDEVRIRMSHNGRKRIVERWTGSRWVKYMDRAR